MARKKNTLKNMRKPMMKKCKTFKQGKNREEKEQRPNCLSLKLWEEQWHKHPRKKKDFRIEHRGLKKSPNK